jgi:hypothetical protein
LRYLLIHYIDESILSWHGDGHELPDPEEDRALEAWDAEMIARGILTGGGALFPASHRQDRHVRTAAVPGGGRGGEEVIAADPPGGEKQALLHFLDYQRASVLSTVAGLDEEAWHRPVVPSGWTPAGLVEHLGDAERHWFQRVITGSETDLPWDEGRPPYDPQAAFVCDRPAADVIAYYREQCERSNAVLAAAPLSARPRGRHGDPDVPEPKDVRSVVLHMIEETACHAGHLDIARELLDGRTGLGLR